ncbi:hypothetical protein BDV96DRAFT_603695 [Lophiotrema nucula]|uniref:Uncharacterized protein n=1 Tax=Lophiotrema nucula TaxID=690887 RepID=A0A6A5YWX0_9PLEO|nr:hypothetical protein BDV96DRAFT_603695 [Lophiotrema nucula]
MSESDLDSRLFPPPAEGPQTNICSPGPAPPVDKREYVIVYFMARVDAFAAEWGPLLAGGDFKWLEAAKVWMSKNELVIQEAAKKRLVWSRKLMESSNGQLDFGETVHSRENVNIVRRAAFVDVSNRSNNSRKRPLYSVEDDESDLADDNYEDLYQISKKFAAHSLEPPKKRFRLTRGAYRHKEHKDEQEHSNIRNEKADRPKANDALGATPFWASPGALAPKQTRPINLIPVINELVPYQLCASGRKHPTYTRILCYNEYTDDFEFITYTHQVDWHNQQSVDALLKWREELYCSDADWMWSQNIHRMKEGQSSTDKDEVEDDNGKHLDTARIHLILRLSTRSFPVEEGERALWWKDAIEDEREASYNVWNNPLRYEDAAAANALLNAAIIPPVGYQGPLYGLKKGGKAEALLTKVEHKQIQMSEEAQKIITREHDNAWEQYNRLFMCRNKPQIPICSYSLKDKTLLRTTWDDWCQSLRASMTLVIVNGLTDIREAQMIKLSMDKIKALKEAEENMPENLDPRKPHQRGMSPNLGFLQEPIRALCRALAPGMIGDTPWWASRRERGTREPEDLTDLTLGPQSTTIDAIMEKAETERTANEIIKDAQAVASR